MDLFEWAEKNPQTEVEGDGSILVRTNSGEKRILPIWSNGRIAVHLSLDKDGCFVITHIASGRSIIQFSPIVNQDAACDLARRFAVLDYDHWWHNGQPPNMADQVTAIFREWSLANYDFVSSWRAFPTGRRE